MQSSSRFTAGYLKRLIGWATVLAVLFIAALLLFVFIAHQIIWEQEEEIDNRFFALLQPYINSSRTQWMEWITYGASSTFLQVGYGILVVGYLFKKNWKRALEISAIGLGGYVINYAMKLSFQRLRPPNPVIEPLHNFSFPSGHATSGFIFYGLLVYLLSKTDVKPIYKYIISTVLIFLALLIGFSRIYLRLHYLSDVVAGACVGFAWLLMVIGVMEWLKKKTDKKLHERNEAKDDLSPRKTKKP